MRNWLVIVKMYFLPNSKKEQQKTGPMEFHISVIWIMIQSSNNNQSHKLHSSFDLIGISYEYDTPKCKQTINQSDDYGLVILWGSLLVMVSLSYLVQ